ncbi:hypothetical protein Tco_0071322 [Tanacetum coccineum]
MVAEDERQRAVLNENINPHESTAFKAFQRRNGPPGSNKESSETKGMKEGIEHCIECNKDGHKREGCFKLIGYPEWWLRKKGEKKGRARNSEGTKPVANMAHKEDEEATYFEAPVVIPNGDSIPVKGKWDYVLPGGTKVNGVLYVPEFKCNLLSNRNLIGAGRCRGGLYQIKMIQGRKAMATTIET